MVGHQTLNLAIGVRVPASQPMNTHCVPTNNNVVVAFLVSSGSTAQAIAIVSNVCNDDE